MLTFNTITESDANLIENYVNSFEPYSDFNFVSIYSWAKHSQAKYCITEDCLYLMLPDYTTQKPIFTLLCKKKHRQNLNLYSLWLQQNNYDVRFDLVPQIVIEGLQTMLLEESERWILYEDRDSFDYIIDTALTTHMYGNRYSDFRYKLSLFDRTHDDDLEIKNLNPKDKGQVMAALKLGDKWARSRNQVVDFYEDELLAYSRFLQLASSKPSIDYIAIYEKNSLIALASFEIVNKDYAIGHFLKFNPAYKGVYYKLVHEVCKRLYERKVKLINIEQDLGIQGLRSAKSHLRPVGYLKKYSLSLINQN